MEKAPVSENDPFNNASLVGEAIKSSRENISRQQTGRLIQIV